eukprot:gene8743-9465_t
MLALEAVNSPKEYIDIIKEYFINQINHLENNENQEKLRDEYYQTSLLLSRVRRMQLDEDDDEEEEDSNSIGQRYCIRNLETNSFHLFAISPSPSHSIIIGYGDIESTLLLAEYFIDQFPDYILPGVTGRADLATAFCEKYIEATQVVQASYARHLLLVLKEYEPPHRTVLGRLIQADESHLELLIQWMTKFVIDAKLPGFEVTREYVEAAIGEKAVYLWFVEERPVSMSIAAISEDMVRFGWVYTPDEDRGHGYASILVNLLSKQFLDEGKVCLLHADEDNPISNSIYHKIGYRAISNDAVITFRKPQIDVIESSNP